MLRRSADRRRGRRLIWVCLAACALLSANVPPAAAAGRQDDHAALCGILPLLDELLGCRAKPPTALPEPDGQSQGNGATASSTSPPTETPPTVSPTPRYVDDTLLLRFRTDASAQQRAQAVSDAGVTVVRTIGALGITVVQMPPDRRDEALQELQASTAVAHVERDAVLERLTTTPNDTDWSAQWGLRRIDLPAAWDRTRGANVVVAVLDTGVDGDVPDLRSAVVPGFNAVDPQAQPADDNGHGTSVAGIIAARANNHQGIAGICWTCSVLPVKVLGADGKGDTALVAAGLVRAVDAGARVISMSLGGTADDQTLDQAVAYALGKGAVIVAAAGNNGASTPFYPAAIPGVVGVAATDESDHLYSWSNFGSWVQLAAPGCNPAPASSGDYVSFCGTSSATPVVAGLIALELSVEPTADRDTVVGALESTAVPIGGAVRFGRVDAEAALASLGAPSTQTTPATPTTPATQPAVHTRTFALRGDLRRGSLVFRRSLVAGSLTATLRAPTSRVLVLTLSTAQGRLVARARGHAPLRIVGHVSAGTFTLAIHGARAKTAVRIDVTERTDA